MINSATLRVLEKGDGRWWPLAARRLYECGGPPADLSILQYQAEESTKLRGLLLKWYGLR